MKKACLVIFVVGLLGGCAFGHQKFYQQSAPMQYPPTQSASVFAYGNADIDQLYNVLFSDYLIVGRSSFNGPYEDPKYSMDFAKEKGADLLVTTVQFTDQRTSLLSLSTPTQTTTNFSGYTGSGSFYGSATTFGTNTTFVPIEVNRYEQNGLYLRNENKVVPLWERTGDQYKKTAIAEIEGVWSNEDYKIHVYQSGTQIVGFLLNTPPKLDAWKLGDLKFIFGAESGKGVYLMGDKTPMPGEFAVNKFGHLEIHLYLAKVSFSFAKQK